MPEPASIGFSYTTGRHFDAGTGNITSGSGHEIYAEAQTMPVPALMLLLPDKKPVRGGRYSDRDHGQVAQSLDAASLDIRFLPQLPCQILRPRMVVPL